jgi:uncharacterized protein YodC (DUF2158 family)
MPNAFNLGDVVKLKSGGPPMTVTAMGRDAHGNPEVTCSWFNAVKPRSAAWPPEALEPATV